MALTTRPTALIVLDGFGIAPSNLGNAVSSANKPFFDALLKTYPALLLEASSLEVGLPRGEVGNSEVGHTTIGSGILRYQSLPRIDKSISTGQFFKLPILQTITERVAKGQGKLHLVGLIGNGGVHASQEHLEALITFCKHSKIWDKTFIHAFLDGRDSARDIGALFVQKLIDYCEKDAKIATISGRFYAMDRNKNWDRIKMAYDAMVLGKSDVQANDPLAAVKSSYEKGTYDEEFLPTVIVGKDGSPLAKIEDGDTVIFFNFRADRGRELTESLVVPDFDKFPATHFSDILMATFTEYQKDLPVKVLFPPEIVENPVAKIVSDYNLKQLHIAETEKYAHVTFFLNGAREDKFVGEERILIPSPAVRSYDEKPEMSAFEVTDNIIKSLKSDAFDFYAINYANPDMVGHTGNLQATIKAIEAVDKCLGQVVPEIVNRGGQVFIIGDHGNAEEMVNLSTGEIDKEHNIYPVPFLAIGNKFRNNPNLEIINNDLSTLTPAGILADIAPTILGNMGLELPPEMTGIKLL